MTVYNSQSPKVIHLGFLEDDGDRDYGHYNLLVAKTSAEEDKKDEKQDKPLASSSEDSESSGPQTPAKKTSKRRSIEDGHGCCPL